MKRLVLLVALCGLSASNLEAAPKGAAKTATYQGNSVAMKALPAPTKGSHWEAQKGAWVQVVNKAKGK